MILQKKLAESITTFVHGAEECASAQQTTEQLFGKKEEINLHELSEADLLNAMEGVPVHTIVGASIQTGIDIVSFLFDTGIFPSKGEARKMVQGGGISINREKIIDHASLINETNLLAEKYIAVQKGKKNHYLVKLG
jgi:tyrosyl-tRNA synthetase